MRKRILSTLLCIALMLSLIPTVAFAENSITAEGTGWYIDVDGCLHITGDAYNPCGIHLDKER